MEDVQISISVTIENFKTLKELLDDNTGNVRYFEDGQIKVFLNAPDREKQSERRNRTILILGYDASTQVGELVVLKVRDLHFDAETPYIRILGKSEKYQSVPLMNKMVRHLHRYLGEFHRDAHSLIAPLFYAVTHSRKHSLSDDCAQKLLKKYAKMPE